MSIENLLDGWLAEQFPNLAFLLRLPTDTSPGCATRPCPSAIPRLRPIVSWLRGSASS